jgi:type IV pilus assembly protein PilA
VIRSRVSEALAAAGACKTSVSEYFATKGFPPRSLAESGCSNVATQYVASIDVDSGTNIIVTLSMSPDLGAAAGKTIRLFSEFIAANEGMIVAWVCRPMNMDPKYLPGTCRDPLAR